MGSEIPEWAMTEADRVGAQIYGRHERGFVMWPLITRSSYHPKDIIARALVAAERRGIERAAKVAERDADWTAFRRRNSVNWKGEETNVFSAPPDPDDTMPTDANVFAYGIGILTGEVIAAAIRQLGDTP